MLAPPNLPQSVSIPVHRSFDARAVNALLNHPDIHPGLALGLGELDATMLIENLRNVVLMAEHGGALFVWSGPGVYDAHDFFLPSGRGKWALEASKTILGAMFDLYDAEMIWAQTPVENRACRFFNRRLGFKSRGVEHAILIPGQPAREVELFVLKGGDLCL